MMYAIVGEHCSTLFSGFTVRNSISFSLVESSLSGAFWHFASSELPELQGVKGQVELSRDFTLSIEQVGHMTGQVLAYTTSKLDQYPAYDAIRQKPSKGLRKEIEILGR